MRKLLLALTLLSIPLSSEAFAQQLLCAASLHLATPFGALFGDIGSQSLFAVDDVLALELLVGTLHRDDADHQFFRQRPEGWQGQTRPKPSLADFPLQPVDDLLIQRRQRGGGDGRNDDPGPAHVTVHINYTQLLSGPAQLRG